MQRTTVLLLFGGESSEHDVSISSARNVYAAMDDTKFDVVLCFIDRHGKWWLLEDLPAQIDISRAPQLVAGLGSRSFITLPGNKIISPDVILPILHGKNGEDGSVQGLAQLLHIPIVGCDMTGSVLAMDKIAAKEIFQVRGLNVVPYQVYHKGEPQPSFEELTQKLGSPIFVKPVRAGSSVGISKVEDKASFDEALESALQHDEFVLIEQAVPGARELEVAVLGTPPHHRATKAGEIRPDRDFYDYESKYNNDSHSELIIPADIDEATATEIHRQALLAYDALKCRGFSRVDFFLSADNTLYINEINSIPGFTNISMYPKLWRESGISYPELIEQLIAIALGRKVLQ